MVGRADPFRSRRSPRNAWFTARSFGNARATCGSSTTMLDASDTRATYFPPTRVPKFERLYSGRSASVVFRLPFFIDVPFGRCRLACSDDSTCAAVLGVRDDQETTAR